MSCKIWYHLSNLKNVKNTHGIVLLLAFACNFTNISTPPWVFFTFLNPTNGKKLRDRLQFIFFYIRLIEGPCFNIINNILFFSLVEKSHSNSKKVINRAI